MGVKSDFITALRTTPDGITGFTTTAIPTLATIAQPTTVDDAIIAQGVLAYNLNLIFKAFEGLTPIELLLRIGQHSNVAEALLLSGLEYLKESNTQLDFSIKEPTDGTTYAQGDIRIIVTAKSSKIATVVVTVSDEDSTSFDVTLATDDGATWYGYARCEEIGNYTLAFAVTFQDDAQTTKTASLTLSVATEGEDTTNPEGEDLEAFNTALAILDQYYQDAIKAASGNTAVENDTFDKVISAGKSVIKAAEAVAKICIGQDISANIQAAKTALINANNEWSQ